MMSTSDMKGHKPDVAPGRPGEYSSYAEYYRSVKDNLRLSEAFLDLVATSRYTKYFIPDEEFGRTRQRYEVGGPTAT
jgi:hypothetical protein